MAADILIDHARLAVLVRCMRPFTTFAHNDSGHGLVWGREHMEDTNYLKVHIKHLRHKLKEDAAAPKYIFTAHNVGYGFAMTGQGSSS